MQTYIKTPVGKRLKSWRQQRGVSQLDLALDSDTSSKHLSFVETGKAHPSRELILRIVKALAIPMEASNNLLIVAGYAPSFQGTGLSSPQMLKITEVFNHLMTKNEPNPSVLIDQNWAICNSNQSFSRFCQHFIADRQLLNHAPNNLLTLLLHPQGLIYYIKDKVEFYQAIYSRVRRAMAVKDDVLEADQLLTNILAYSPISSEQLCLQVPQLMIPFTLVKKDLTLSFALSTTTLGSPVNLSLQEIQMEFIVAEDSVSEVFLDQL